jgi:uncharacterized RDD family membrane protein YckC
MTADLPGDAYAGAVSRLAAYVVDAVALSVLFSGATVVTAFLVSLVTGSELDLEVSQGLAAVGSGLWWFGYFGASWAFAGRTIGMGLLGIKVAQPDGERASVVRSIVRALALPLSFALCGLGFLGILFHPQRRALHDLIARTAVVYSAPSPRAARRRPV